MQLPAFLRDRQRKFIISIGDEGAVLVYMVAGKVEGRFFFNGPDALEIERVFLNDPEAPVYVLTDVSDQSYMQHSLPPVSALNVQKLVKRRLEKDFDKNDIKGALLIERSKTGRKDWHYIFVSVRNDPPFSLWIETLTKLPNRIAGIFLLPVEAEAFIRDVKKAVMAENVAKPAQWQMLVTHNKVGGLRQIILKNGRIAFTRMAQPVGGTSPGVIAGNIEQETLNTMEFLRRLSYEESAGLDIIIITSAEVKKQLEASRFHATNVFVLTPHEVAGQLGLERATEPKDKFADVVMLAYFGQNNKPILKLTTPLLTKVEQFAYGRVALKGFTYLAIPVSVLLTISSAITAYGLQDDIKRAEDELNRAKTNMKNVQQRHDGMSVQKTQASDLLSLYDMLNDNIMQPFEFFSTIARAKGQTPTVKDVRFLTAETADKASKKTLNSISVALNIEYLNTSPNSDAYLREVNEFAARMQKELLPLKVEFSGLPGQKEYALEVKGGENEAAKPVQPTRDPPPIRVSINGPVPPEAQRKFFFLEEMTLPGVTTFTPVQGGGNVLPPMTPPTVPPSTPPSMPPAPPKGNP